MITTVNLVSKDITIDIIIDYIPHTVHFIPVAHLFWDWKFVPLNLPYLFFPPPLLLW